MHESGVFTELRVGTYVYGDRRCLALGVTPLEDCALRVVATVVSRPTRDHAVLDAGSKTLTSDTLPGLEGDVRPRRRVPRRRHPPPSEEHADVDLSACDRIPEIGDVVTIVPNHACGTVNMHDSIALHRGGGDDRDRRGRRPRPRALSACPGLEKPANDVRRAPRVVAVSVSVAHWSQSAKGTSMRNRGKKLGAVLLVVTGMLYAGVAHAAAAEVKVDDDGASARMRRSRRSRPRSTPRRPGDTVRSAPAPTPSRSRSARARTA